MEVGNHVRHQRRIHHQLADPVALGLLLAEQILLRPLNRGLQLHLRLEPQVRLTRVLLNAAFSQRHNIHSHTLRISGQTVKALILTREFQKVSPIHHHARERIRARALVKPVMVMVILLSRSSMPESPFTDGTGGQARARGGRPPSEAQAKLPVWEGERPREPKPLGNSAKIRAHGDTCPPSVTSQHTINT